MCEIKKPCDLKKKNMAQQRGETTAVFQRKVGAKGHLKG